MESDDGYKPGLPGDGAKHCAKAAKEETANSSENRAFFIMVGFGGCV